MLLCSHGIIDSMLLCSHRIYLCNSKENFSRYTISLDLVKSTYMLRWLFYCFCCIGKSSFVTYCTSRCNFYVCSRHVRRDGQNKKKLQKALRRQYNFARGESLSRKRMRRPEARLLAWPTVSAIKRCISSYRFIASRLFAKVPRLFPRVCRLIFIFTRKNSIFYFIHIYFLLHIRIFNEDYKRVTDLKIQCFSSAISFSRHYFAALRYFR